MHSTHFTSLIERNPFHSFSFRLQFIVLSFLIVNHCREEYSRVKTCLPTQVVRTKNAYRFAYRSKMSTKIVCIFICSCKYTCSFWIDTQFACSPNVGFSSVYLQSRRRMICAEYTLRPYMERVQAHGELLQHYSVCAQQREFDAIYHLSLNAFSHTGSAVKVY